MGDESAFAGSAHCWSAGGRSTATTRLPGGDNVPLERISLTHGPLATNIWTRVLPR